MNYSVKDVLDYVQEEDVKFIRLAFCDVFGKQKNISIMPQELERAFLNGISIDASAIRGFGCEVNSDLFLHPDPSTLKLLPWRPAHGRVVRMFCDIKHPDGKEFASDTRRILMEAVARAKQNGFAVNFGAEFEFYLFKTDENGNPTRQPYDAAGYMDIAPEDKGENVRREICLNLEQMGIYPESSHHEEGPGQHEIDFRYSDALSAADNTVSFKAVVKTIAARNGLYAEFSPKPISGEPGNGLHINISVSSEENGDRTPQFMAGILRHIREMTAVLNPTEESYFRLGELKAPKYISWSPENRSQLIRIPAAQGKYKRIELRSPDPETNIYLAFALLIHAGLDGIEKNLTPPPPANINLFSASSDVLKQFEALPETLTEAKRLCAQSKFIRGILPKGIIKTIAEL